MFFYTVGREIVIFPTPVAAREFGERRALRTSPAGLGLLRRRQFRGPAHVLPALLCPAAAHGGASAEKIALHVGQSAPSARLAAGARQV
jgi:hypothetical protein